MIQKEPVKPPAKTSKKLEGLSDYDRVILEVFRRHYQEGDTLLTFSSQTLERSVNRYCRIQRSSRTR